MIFTLSGFDKVTCEEHNETVNHPQGSICRLARVLARKGVDLTETVEVYRGSTKCFNDMRLIDWARLTIVEDDDGTRHEKTKIVKSDDKNIAMHELLFGKNSPK